MSSEESPFPFREAVSPPPARDSRWLKTPVRAFMRAGVVTVDEGASLLQVQRAMVSHGVHAVLITDSRGPVGWVTASGLLPWLDEEPALYPARAAVSEKAAFIAPGASARAALEALAQSAVGHLLVRPDTAASPQGVVSEIDLVRLSSQPCVPPH